MVYGTRCELDGFKFDSEVERDYYIKLKSMKECGFINDFTMQVTYELFDGFLDFRGNKVQPMTYIADYEIILNNGEKIIIDTKGSKASTEESARIKQKLFMLKYPTLPIYFVGMLSNFLGKEWVEVTKGYDFGTKLRTRYIKLNGKWRRGKSPNWTVEDWKEHFEFEDFHGLFYIWKSTKKLKKGD